MIDSKEVWRWVRILIIVGVVATALGYGFAALINQDNPKSSKVDVNYNTLQEQYKNDPDFKSNFDSEFPDEDGITYTIKKNTIILEYDLGDVAANGDNAKTLKEGLEDEINNSNENIDLNDYIKGLSEEYGHPVKLQFRYVNTDGDIVYKRTIKQKG